MYNRNSIMSGNRNSFMKHGPLEAPYHGVRIWGFLMLLLLFLSDLVPTHGFTVPRPIHPPAVASMYQRRSTGILLPKSHLNPGGPIRRIHFSSALAPPSPSSWWQQARAKFRARPGTYLLIPCIAAVVGWFTNWLAVQMIFYPLQYRGWNLYRPNPEIPLGFLGWQGILPCKTRIMTNTLVDMVTTQLLSVPEALGRLDPRVMSHLLSPALVPLTRQLLQDLVLPGGPSRFSRWFLSLPLLTRWLEHVTADRLLWPLLRQLPAHADRVFPLRTCVVRQMVAQPGKLGQLFRQCGQAELNFLTNSGLWFGFLLGLVQMAVALVWDNPWSLSIGGGIVGLATNWLALKWIFCPVEPVRLLGGLLTLQGKFLRRQPEVAAAFAAFFSRQVLSGAQIWSSICTDGRPALTTLLQQHVSSLGGLRPATVARIAERAVAALPLHSAIVAPYLESALALETTLRRRMELMTPRQFERVLHPIFEEDEGTLIVAGAVLGFGAGLIQQGLETGVLRLPPWRWWRPSRAVQDDDDEDDEEEEETTTE
jgi:uncharacterized membrane protein YheB (UPF0754 family)